MEEIIERSGTILVKRQILAPGEATDWHVDPYRRFSVVVRGERLAIEYRDGSTLEVSVAPGLAEWDEPTQHVHRAINVGSNTYEEVVLFFLASPDDVAQPRFDHDAPRR